MHTVEVNKREDSATVAYFSMEIGIDPDIPTYSGGLGVLAGDTLRAAADLGAPVIGITLLYRRGYFRQHLDAEGNQSESPYEWAPEEHLRQLDPQAEVIIEGRVVRLRVWRHLLRGVHGHTVPVYFLDSALSENAPWDRALTDHLYGGDTRYRFCQETLLGVGGIAMLTTLHYHNIATYHMNEGHSSLLGLALLENLERGQPSDTIFQSHVEEVRRRCVFTTHTPIPAGHDQFPLDLVARVLGEERTKTLERLGCTLDGKLNMTYLGLFFSHYVNGVSMRHEQISQGMFPNYPFNSITNGVHAATWISPAFGELYDQFIPEWRHDNRYLRYAISIPLEEIQQTHVRAKLELLQEVKCRTGLNLSPEAMTFGFARRATQYKRADLLFSDIERLRRIAREVGPLQILYAGKAHPRDENGKSMIRNVFEAAAALKNDIDIVYMEEYDMALAKYVCSGVDVWLNTPQKPHEASGTSGMKAAMNGVPSLSVLDGWWVEGHVEGVTGWSIGFGWEKETNPQEESTSLYDKLENIILPMFYGRPIDFAQVRRSAIALNGSFFNAQRMMSQYMQNAYSTNPTEDGIVSDG